ncbi:MAG: alpha/beta fold hydrolase, partial [Chloroflexota bacterium]|nr:alpha/beta fold hydrolase [Chloroflexota bacterium]
WSATPLPFEGAAADAAATYIAPRNDVERTLAQFWQDLMGLERVSVHDDFFELGGYSLIAVRLFAKIKKAFGIDLSLATLFQAPTVAACAEVIAGELGISLQPLGAAREADQSGMAGGADDADPAAAVADGPAGAPAARRSSTWTPLVPIQAGGDRPTFFCIHGAGGNVLNFRDLAVRLGKDQPFVALQAQGVDGKLPPLTRVEHMAALYLTAIRTVQPQGPYYLGGHSAGGVIAFEMAHQLRQQGETAALLAFIDTFCPALPVRRGLYANWLNLRARGLGYGVFLPQKVYGFFRRCIRQLRVKRLRGRPEALPHQLRDQQLWDTHIRALRAYDPQIYPGTATLFRAAISDPADDYGVDDLGWSGFLGEGLEVKIVPGSHETLVLEPNVSVLGAELRASIDRASDRDAGRTPGGRNGSAGSPNGAPDPHDRAHGGAATKVIV